MKKISLALILIIALSLSTKAQYVNIPDVTFRNVLKSMFPTAFNAGGQMDTTNSAIISEHSIIFSNMNINSIEGIKYFKELLFLYVDNNNLTEIPVLPNTTTYLDCSHNQITQLKNVENVIWGLVANDNKIIQIFTLNNYLRELFLQNNLLTNIPKLPDEIKTLNVTGNQNLFCLPVLPDVLQINSLWRCVNGICENRSNLILDFDTSNIKCLPNIPFDTRINGNNLTYPICSSTFNPDNCDTSDRNGKMVLLYSSAIAIEIAKVCPSCLGRSNGTIIYFTSSPSTLYLSGSVFSFDTTTWVTKTKIMDLYDGNLDSLKDFIYFPEIEELYINIYSGSTKTLNYLPKGLKIFENKWVSNFKIEEAYPLPDSLISFKANDCGIRKFGTSFPGKLKEIEISRNDFIELPTLPSSLEKLYAFDNPQLFCLPLLPDSLNQLEVNFRTGITCLPNIPKNLLTDFPICNPANNKYHCQSFPVIQGSVYNDLNKNNIKETTEFGRSKIKISLQNGTSTFTQKNGFYEITTDSFGVYNVTIPNTNFYDAVPSSYTHTFNRFNISVADSFALQPNTLKDSIAINAEPLNVAARPGFSYSYLVTSENVGTTTITSNIVFTVDTSKLIVDSVSNNATISNNNINLITSNFMPGEIEDFIVYCRIKSNILIGDSITYFATINGGSATATDSGKVIVRASYDPNEKQATTVLTPLQCSLGKYIDYTIYFQNTGNDTAFTVVLEDTLSNNVLPNTLQMIGSSHNCKTTQKGNIGYFEFNNIQLPDSFANEKKSHGFVHFKVKPKPTLVNGDVVNNKAFIYFDYNSPIITNTAITQINTSGMVLPVNMQVFTVSLVNSNNEYSVKLNWLTSNEKDVVIYNIQRSSDGKSFRTIGQVKAGKNDYQFTDDRLLLTVDGKPYNFYYRIQSIDRDGKTGFSEVRKVEIKDKNNKVEIVENPVRDILQITASSTFINSMATIVNQQGKVVKEFAITGTNQKVDVSNLANGVYYLKTTDGINKFIKR